MLARVGKNRDNISCRLVIENENFNFNENHHDCMREAESVS